MKLELTLYKNCILNETYQNVFSLAIRNQKTILELYLERLTKYIFECNDIYYENSGEFVFDYELIDDNIKRIIYEFNYLKIRQFDDDNNITLIRYCFIDNISIKNDVVYLSYKEDVWHSYINSVAGINESYMSRTRLKSRLYLNEPCELPVKYDGNNTPVIYDLLDMFLYYALVEIQLYDISTGDNPKTYRNTKYYLVRGSIYEQGSYKMSANGLELMMQDLMIIMPSDKIGGHNFEVGDIYILNSDFDLENKLEFDTEQQIGTSGLYVKGLKDKPASFSGITLVTQTVLNNYNNISIGTFDKQIPIINNGTSFDFSIVMYYSCSNICIQLRCLNQIIDITSSYRYDIPVASIRAEEYTQRKIQYNLEKQNMELQTDEGNRWNSVFSGFFGFIGNILKLNFGSAWDNFSKALYKGPFFDWQKENNKLLSITEPQYTNSRGVFGNNSAIVNYRIGLFLLRVNPDNTDFVKQTINNTGYKVYHYTRDFNSLNIKTDMYNTLHYDFLKFDSIDIYGSFPREIAKILNSIFETGVKIWYDENMYYDNYVI